MREIQLYVKGERVDLNPNNTIEIKSNIKDVKDISKVFTDYSKTFEVPASDNNNKIFRHFYNFNITTNSFDARVKHESNIFINHLLFRRGKVFLSGVVMENNTAISYKLRFFGNNITLNDKFKDLKLSSLDLTSFDFNYNRNNVSAIFGSEGKTVDGDTSALIFPLITNKKRLFYDSSLAHESAINYDGNLYRPVDLSSLTNAQADQYKSRGVNESDLKPAIKVYHFIKAIEAKFDLVLIPSDISGTKDFFSKHNPAISNLYLWMSNSGNSIIESEDEGNYFYSAIPTDFYNYAAQTNTNFNYFNEFNGEFIITPEYTSNNINGDYRDFKVHIYPQANEQTIDWRLKWVNKETGNYQTIEGTGNTMQLLSVYSGLSTNQVYYVEFSSKTPMQDVDIRIEARADKGAFLGFGTPDDFEIYTTKNGSAGLNTNDRIISIKDEIPDMKISDFIKGLFKMFNLTAYPIDDETDPEYEVDSKGNPNVLKIQTLDDYYADALNNQKYGLIDITKYINTESHVVDTSLPFSEIEFKYKESETLLKSNHEDVFGESFGDSNVVLSELYPDIDLFFGEKYEIKSPFSILKYERIENTDVQWGYAAGGDFSTEDADLSAVPPIPPKGNYNSENVKSLLFYGIRETTTSGINFNSGNRDESSRYTQYYRPSNTNETVALNSEGFYETAPSYSLTFDAEIDEFLLTDFGSASNSLFNKFYRKYIKSIFDPTKRIFRFEAYLPPSFLISYKLNDQVKVQDVVYRINSITTSLLTGKSKLELINLNAEEIIE